MDAATYFLALFVSFLGIVVGSALNFMAKEEIKPGRKYFFLLKKASLILMIIFFVNYFKLNPFLKILFYLLSVTLLSFVNFQSYFVYPALSFLFYFSSLNNNLFLIQSTLIFIYGLPCGTLFVEKEKRLPVALVKTLLYHIPFMFIALILFYI